MQNWTVVANSAQHFKLLMKWRTEEGPPTRLEILKKALDKAKWKLVTRQTGKLARRVSLANEVLRIQGLYEAELAAGLPKTPVEPKMIDAPWDRPGVRGEKVKWKTHL